MSVEKGRWILGLYRTMQWCNSWTQCRMIPDSLQNTSAARHYKNVFDYIYSHHPSICIPFCHVPAHLFITLWNFFYNKGIVLFTGSYLQEELEILRKSFRSPRLTNIYASTQNLRNVYGLRKKFIFASVEPEFKPRNSSEIVNSMKLSRSDKIYNIKHKCFKNKKGLKHTLIP